MALSTMYPGVNNSPSTALKSSITATATTIEVLNSTVLPAAKNLAVIGNTTDAEIISYDVKNGNILTGVKRALAGTTAKAWPANTIVARNFTLQDYKTLCENITDLDNRKQDASALKSLAFKNQAALGSDVTGALKIENGGTNANSAEGARLNLGIGTLGTKEKVTLTTDVSGTLPVGNGGTGITANPSMTVNLESTSAASVFASAPKPGVSGVLPVARGGSGINKNPSMLTQLDSTTAASVYQESPRPGVTGILKIANGGTESNSAAGARSKLGITSIATRPNYEISTSDLTAGSSTLSSGKIYFYIQ